jgi:REP-associated tyrosine transposase
MARANRLGGYGGIFHVTHRCHNREFLLKFALDRGGYRAKLRDHLREFEVALLDYCITSNHVHLLLDAEERRQISGLMRTVAGEFARAYNRRKERMNAFWGDNFHATLVEEGTYLWRCLCYIELNMVRCGQVAHPSQWDWLGYHEIMGQRQRYRVLDLEQLCWRLQTDSLAEVRNNLEAALTEQIAQEQFKREPCWTESLAVGSAGFLERIKPLILSRQETELVQRDGQIWVLQETPIPYGAKTGSKNAPKHLN